MSDIAQRLRDGGNDICRDGPMWPGDDMLEGYAEITRLRALVEELKADRIRINDEAETEIKRLREALDIDKAVDAAIFEWGSGKHREYDYGNAVYFKVNWRSLPAYRDAVDVQIGRRARKALEGGE